jgi:hypothetical protein
LPTIHELGLVLWSESVSQYQFERLSRMRSNNRASQLRNSPSVSRHFRREYLSGDRKNQIIRNADMLLVNRNEMGNCVSKLPCLQLKACLLLGIVCRVYRLGHGVSRRDGALVQRHQALPVPISPLVARLAKTWENGLRFVSSVFRSSLPEVTQSRLEAIEPHFGHRCLGPWLNIP